MLQLLNASDGEAVRHPPGSLFTFCHHWQLIEEESLTCMRPLPVKSQKSVSFRQACMNLFESSGMVGCRRETSWRTADEHEKGTRHTCRA